MAVADGVTNDQRDETVLAGIHGARAHAAAGADAGDQQRVDAKGGERGGERSAEERTRVLLGDDRLAGNRLEACRESGEVGAGARFETLQCWHLAEEHTAVTPACLVLDVGVSHRYAGTARGLQQRLSRGACRFGAGVQRRACDEVCLYEIDHQQRRPPARLQCQPESAGGVIVGQ